MIKYYGQTDTGMCRRENEDAFAVRELSAQKNGTQTVLAVACDGMGGAKGGKVASALAVDTFTEYLTCHALPTRAAVQRSALSAANRAVRKCAAESRGELEGMGCTLVSALATEKSLLVLWVGDSRAYLYRDGLLLPLTRDHSYVRQMMDAGLMSAEEAKRSPHRNIITRAVGAHATVKGDVVRCSWRRGDRLLLCTDGLTGCVSEREICSILKEGTSLFDMANELIVAANCRGGEDNITALLLENTKEITPNA